MGAVLFCVSYGIVLCGLRCVSHDIVLCESWNSVVGAVLCCPVLCCVVGAVLC